MGSLDKKSTGSAARLKKIGLVPPLREAQPIRKVPPRIAAINAPKSIIKKLHGYEANLDYVKKQPVTKADEDALKAAQLKRDRRAARNLRAN